MRRLPALVAALLLPVAQPLILGTAVTTGGLLAYPAPAQAQSAEAVAKVAEAITVRVEGATQGSGVLVKRDGNRYTVLTAWHVVSGQRSGEELDVFTPDGQRHKLEQGSIKRMGEVDMAMLSFTSLNTYEVAQIGDPTSVSMGSTVYVGGFPLPSSAVPSRLMRFLKGDVIANATVAIPNGYQLLYSNPTLPGMSGGAVINAQGQLVGIHGQGETDSKMSEQNGVAVKTGTNQAVPIAYYMQYFPGAAVVASSTQATTADDYMAQAQAMARDLPEGIIVLSATEKVNAFELDKKWRHVIFLIDRSLALRPNAKAYLMRGNIYYNLLDFEAALPDYMFAISLDPQSAGAYFGRGNISSNNKDYQAAVADYTKSIEYGIDPRTSPVYLNRGGARYNLGDNQGAIADYTQAIRFLPGWESIYYDRGKARFEVGDKQGAISDFSKAVSMDPKFASAYNYRGTVKQDLGDIQGAIADYSKAIGANPLGLYYFNRATAKHLLKQWNVACRDYKKSIALGANLATHYLQSLGGSWCRNMR